MATEYRIWLTAEQQAEWHRRWWAAGTAPAERERLEMVRLSSHDHSVPWIAGRLGRHEQTVRRVLTRFLAQGVAGLAHRPRAGRLPRLTTAHLAAGEAHLDAAAARGDVWTAPRIAAVVATHFGVRYDPAQICRRLRASRWSPQRPLQRAAQRDEAAIARWYAERWPVLIEGRPKKAAPSSG